MERSNILLLVVILALVSPCTLALDQTTGSGAAVLAPANETRTQWHRHLLKKTESHHDIPVAHRHRTQNAPAASHEKWHSDCWGAGVLAILFSDENFKGAPVALTHSAADLASMLCFTPKSVLLAPGVEITLGTKNGPVNAASNTPQLSVSSPTQAALVKDGQDVPARPPDVAPQEVLEEFHREVKQTHNADGYPAAKFRFDKSHRFLLKYLARKMDKNKKPPKPLFGDNPSPESCFQMTHVRSAQLQCHPDPAWLIIGSEFVPHFGGLTHSDEGDIAAMENALYGLRSGDILDLDTGSRNEHLCGMDIKHVTLAQDKGSSMTRNEILKKRGSLKTSFAKNQGSLIGRLLDGGTGRSKKAAAAALLPKMRRLQKALDAQHTALLFDSSILLVLGTSEATGGLEARVKMIDFGKENHVYHDRFPSRVPSRTRTFGHQCGYACGAAELVARLEGFAAGKDGGTNKCMAKCQNTLWSKGSSKCRIIHSDPTKG